MDIEEALALLNRGGTVALLVLIITGFVRGWLITRREFEDMKGDRDQWRSAAMKSGDNADRALLMLEQWRSGNSHNPSYPDGSGRNGGTSTGNGSTGASTNNDGRWTS